MGMDLEHPCNCGVDGPALKTKHATLFQTYEKTIHLSLKSFSSAGVSRGTLPSRRMEIWASFKPSERRKYFMMQDESGGIVMQM